MKKRNRIISIILTFVMIMQLQINIVSASSTEYELILSNAQRIPGGDVIYRNVDKLVTDSDMQFALLYNSSQYDEDWVDRDKSVITFKNTSTDEEYSFEQESCPLKCVVMDSWSDGVYIPGQYDLTFSVPESLPYGVYYVNVHLDIPNGKETDSRVKPINFIIEEFVVTSMPTGGAGASGPDRNVVSAGYYDAAKVCYDLGLMDSIYTNYNKTATKEDVTYVLTELAGLTDAAEAAMDTSGFTDLETGTYLNGCAAVLRAKGLMLGESSGIYAPDTEMLYEKIIKAFVDLLGYSYYAQMRGGYPTGYMAVAYQTGIAKNVSAAMGSTISCEQLAQLTYNSLEAKRMEITSYTVDGPVYAIVDNTLLYLLGYDKYIGEVAVSDNTATVSGKLYNSDNLKGTAIENKALDIFDNDITGYEDTGMKLYVKDNAVISGLNYYSASFTVNENASITDTCEVNIAFDTIGYSKYKINDGEFLTIPVSKNAAYTLPDGCGSKTIKITFSNNAESVSATLTKTITLQANHTITYITDGSVFHTDSIICGGTIPPLENTPSKSGYTFEGWDSLPETMPDGDVTVNAIFTPVETESNANTFFTVSDTISLEPISGAQVFVTNADGSVNEKAVTDTEGKARFDLASGTYSVQVIANGYQLRNFVVEKTDEIAEFTSYMNKTDILDLQTVVKIMTMEEIIDAGIDVDAAENNHIYKCAAVLKFTPVLPGGNVTITPVEINLDYICDDNGTIIKYEPVYHPESGAVIYPVSKDIYLIVYSSVTWLKEIFDVQLIAANTSSVETIESCVASLNLPVGLSLAVMTGTQQSATVTMPDIAPQSTSDIHWYICGDKEGEYYIDGTVSALRTGGGISEEFNASFTTKDPITVLAGSAMKLTIEAEKTAVAGMPYRLKYTLENVSSKTLNNVALNVLGGKFCKAYSVTDIVHEAEKGESDGLSGTFNDGYVLNDPLFEPDEALSGVFEIIFGTGISTEYIEYMVADMFTVTGNGSTTTIPTEIILVDSVATHTWDNGTIKQTATAIKDGVIEYTCTGCGATRAAPIPAYGTGGYFGPDDRFSWELSDSGTISIAGTGVMTDFSDSSKLPWNAHLEAVTDVQIQDGISSIGEGMFEGCTSLKSITIPASITEIGENAFKNCGSLDKIYYGAGRSEWENIITGSGNDTVKDEYIYYEKPSLEADAKSVSVYAPKEESVLIVVTRNQYGYTEIIMVPITSSIQKAVDELSSTSDVEIQKVFLWNDTGMLKPLCSAIGVPS